MMRAIAIVSTLLAFGKVWAYDQTYRAAVEQALAAAYLDRATAACARLATSKVSTAVSSRATNRQIQVAVGDPRVDVAFWDIRNDAWERRYRRAYVLMNVDSDGRRGRCAYDIAHDSAAVANL